MPRKPTKLPNALKHGAFSKATLLPWENVTEFEALHQELREEWHPSGALEEDAVYTILTCLWRKKRVRAKRNLELTTAIQKPEFKPLANEPIPFFQENLDRAKYTLARTLEANRNSGSTAQNRIRDPVAELRNFSSSLFGSIGEVLVRAKIRMLEEGAREHLNKVVPREAFEDLLSWVHGVKLEIDHVLLPKAIAEQEDNPQESYSYLDETAAEFFTIERVMEDIDLEERLDALIDRAIRRLAQAKMMKEISAARKREPLTDATRTMQMIESPNDKIGDKRK